MSEPNWSELRITDSDIDAPDEEQPTATAESAPPDRPARPGVGLRWCAGLATVALLAAAGAVAFAEHRGRTITSVRYQQAPVHAIDAGGCPNGDSCSPLDGLYAGLATAFDVDLPDSQPVFGSDLLDNSTAGVSRTVRIVRLTDSQISVAVLTQCRNDGRQATSRTVGITGRGPRLAAVIRASGPGCSVAVLADVPAGQLVPGADLVRLATDPLILP